MADEVTFASLLEDNGVKVSKKKNGFPWEWIILGGVVVLGLSTLGLINFSFADKLKNIGSSQIQQAKQVVFNLPQTIKTEAPTRLTREQLLSGSFNFDDFRTIAR